METVDLNNDLVRLREQEQREIHRILAGITDQFRSVAGDIETTVDVLADLEIVFAKARFAVDFGCVMPRFGDRLSLLNARHPLLADVLRRQKRETVPLTLTLEGSQRTLLISGPNTGGKTVALKTIGLLALMAQAGLPVPAEAAEFGYIHKILDLPEIHGGRSRLGYYQSA